MEAAAIHENIPIIGAVRLLLTAKRRSHLKQVGPVLETLRRNGYRLSDSLVDYLLAEADEEL